MKQKITLLKATLFALLFVSSSLIFAQEVQYNFEPANTTTNSGTVGVAGDLTFVGGGETFALANNTVTATAMGDALTVDGVTNATAATYPGVISTTFTAMAWLKIPLADYTSGMTFLSYGTLSGTNGFNFKVQNFGGVATLRVEGGGVAFRAQVTGTQMPTLADGNWQHVAVTISTGASDSILFYLNGAVIPGVYGGVNSTDQLAIANVPGSFTIGSTVGGANPFKGSIDDLRMYNTVLTEAEIAAIVNIGISPPTASFTVNNATPVAEEIITFTDTSTGSPTTWTWDFGATDAVGNNTAQNPQVSYPTVGTYTVTLTAGNAGGDAAPLVQTNYITVTAGTSGTGTLQARYNFDGAITDASSYVRNLITQGAFTPTYTADHLGTATSALTASGVYADHLVTAYPGVGAGGARTVTAWFNTAAASGREPIVSWGKNSTGQMFNVMIEGGVPRIEGGASSLKSGDTGLNDGVWHHIAVTFDPVDDILGDGPGALTNCKIYIDGVLSGPGSAFTGTTILNTDITTNFLKIGSAVYVSHTFDGALDDVRVYSRAITATEVVTVMGGAVLAVNDIAFGPNEIKAFPNAVTDILNIQTSVSETLNISVYNVLGRLIKRVPSATQVDMSSLAAGLYVVKVRSGAKVASFKIIKK